MGGETNEVARLRAQLETTRERLHAAEVRIARLEAVLDTVVVAGRLAEQALRDIGRSTVQRGEPAA